MSIDQTKILSIWTNMQTWTVFLLIKVFGTLIMMLLDYCKQHVHSINVIE